MLYVVSGPSGCGKSTLIRRLLAEVPGLRFSVSHTTRPPRPSEREGREYYFVGREAFQRMIKAGAFVEWARVHGFLYGTSKKELARRAGRGDVVLDIDVQGARQVRVRFPEAVSIFIMPPAMGELRRRLRGRGADSPAALRRRLTAARREIRSYKDFDYVVVNDDLDKAAGELRSIVVSRRCRLEDCRRDVVPILRSFKARGSARRGGSRT